MPFYAVQSAQKLERLSSFQSATFVPISESRYTTTLASSSCRSPRRLVCLWSTHCKQTSGIRGGWGRVGCGCLACGFGVFSVRDQASTFSTSSPVSFSLPPSAKRCPLSLPALHPHPPTALAASPYLPAAPSTCHAPPSTSLIPPPSPHPRRPTRHSYLLSSQRP